jgi:membrane-bound serine protease (ClpP class)
MVIIGGIYFELQTPGIGFPLAASAVAALLYFAPLYLEGLAANWEILIFIIGIILIIVELFAIPGFGVTGISGVTLVVAGLTLSMIDNMAFDQGEFPFSQLASAFFTVIIAAFISLVLSIYLSRKLLTSNRFGEIALNTTQDRSAGYTSAAAGYSIMLGKEGIAKTILRPAGKILIDNETYDATSESGFIEKGDKIVVTHYENAQLFVRKIS